MFDTEIVPVLTESLPDEVGLPSDLERIEPGPFLAVILSGIDRSQLSGDDRVRLLQARSRLRANVDAELLADMVAVCEAEAGCLPPGELFEHVVAVTAAEIGAALHWTRRASETHLGLAMSLVEDYPKVWEMLRAGLIDLSRARVICNETIHLDPEIRDQVVDIALQRAPVQTTGLLAARIRRLAIWIDPEYAKKRYENGLAERRVAHEANDDGTANLMGHNLSAPDTAAAMRKINHQAKALKRAGDPRTLDQIRADIFLDLLKGRNINTSHRDRAVIDITVDLSTLAGLDDNPGEIPGWGPVIADIARQVTADQHDAQWQYTITNDDGAVVTNGTTRRRPTTTMKRAVEAKARTCVFPGCRMPARECDIDHNQAWNDGGATTECNLAPLCRHHHTIKHRGWTLTQPKPGSYTWTSPLGHTYTKGPDPP
jgi:hypothetical protein